MDEAKRLVELIPRLRRYARALVGERSSADDLVQDTLERAWAKLHLYRRGTDLRAWLFTVMHNVHVNRVRATRVNDPLEDEKPAANFYGQVFGWRTESFMAGQTQVTLWRLPG